MYKTTVLYQGGDYTDERILETDNELKVLDEDGFIYLNEIKALDKGDGTKEYKTMTVYAINKNWLISMELNKEGEEELELTHILKYVDGEEVITSNSITINMDISEKVAHAAKDIANQLVEEIKRGTIG